MVYYKGMKADLEISDPNSRLNMALAKGQTVFVLTSSDVTSPGTIRDWIKRRIDLGLNKPGDPKLVEAHECALSMEAEKRGWRPGK